MSQILSIHSYRGGTGKSNISANLAYLGALEGQRVALLDTDVVSPGVHLVLGLEKQRITHTLTDFLFGKCELEDAAYDMSASLGLDANGPGALYLLPSSMNLEAISRVVSEGYDVSRLNDEFAVLQKNLELDLLVIDSHPGLNRETMLTTAVSDTLLIVIRPDRQDYHGTAVMIQVASRLQVPRVFMLVNKVPRRFDREAIRERIQSVMGYEMLAAFPLEEEMACLASEGLFVQRFPDHSLSRQIRGVAKRLFSGEGGQRL